MDHSQPWLKVLTGDSFWVDRATEAAGSDDREQDEALAHATTRFSRMKNNTSVREMLLVPLETDVRIAVQGRELVDAIESARRPNSYGAWIRSSEDGIWAKLPFDDQRTEDGPFLRWQDALKRIERSHLYVATTDVERFFGSLQWWRTMEYLAHLLEVDEREVLNGTRLHGRLWEYSELSGMPIGCDLSSVIGNVLLSDVDDELILFASSADGCARWMDDITFGCPTEESGWAMCRHLERGPLRKLRLLVNWGKTHVDASPLIHVMPSSAVDVSLDEGYPAPTIEEARALLSSLGELTQVPKKVSRPLIKAVLHSDLDVEERAEIIADACGHLLAGNDHEIPRRLRGLCGGQPTPAAFTDRALRSIVEGTRPGTPADGEAAEMLINLMDPRPEIGIQGKESLRRLMREDRHERTRATAAWVLADTAEDFDRAVLADLETLSVACARGVVAAKVRAGGRPNQAEWAAAAPPVPA